MVSIYEQNRERRISYEEYVNSISLDSVLEPTHAMPGSPEKLAILVLSHNHPTCNKLFLKDDLFSQSDFSWDITDGRYQDDYEKETNDKEDHE